MSSQAKNQGHSTPLRRGKACLNCRHLKIKCDGVKPTCGPCRRMPKADPCEFNDSLSRTQELEHTVLRLQSQLNELQGGGGGWPSSAAPGSPFSGSSAGGSSDGSFLRFQEPPLVVIESLLRAFLPHATQFGFFLHPTRFRDVALLPFAFGDERRPSPALLCVVYLWGIHLSQSQPYLSSEPLFLRRAQEHIATEISANVPPSHVIHTIQAQVLLTTYLFHNKRFLEAEFHANGAATLVTGHQYHKIRSARPASPPLFGLTTAAQDSSVEEGERIRGFWAVATLQSNLHISLHSGSGTSLCILESPANIDTPWPLEIPDYEAGALHPGYRGQETVRRFLAEDGSGPVGPIAMLYAKASVLLYRAVRLASNWSPDMQPHVRASYINSYTRLDRRITQFWESLPPIYALYPASPDADSGPARALVVVHALTAAAAIRLHRSPNSSDIDQSATGKSVFAARAILECLGDARVGAHRVVVAPIVGTLGTLACRVVMEETKSAETFRISWAASVGAQVGPPGEEERALRGDVQRGLQIMGVYAAGSPLIGSFCFV
ncbi:hypothetical protein FB45DRAFT_1008903 [Roridomyces roridus]|uniref:Zn(2)-C6 fungal-type domain-containing protein n=1 Tax=Roridomyces roridus TaxID=1738132 RepID=A0AAD7B8W2_9AGAR|nr:hypothetical protein FB45DRAFT_1008903 [Roridomyces roridus]